MSAVGTAVDKIAQRIAAADPGSTWAWVTELIEPNRLSSDQWPKLERNHYQLQITRADGSPPEREQGTGARRTTVDYVLRVWTYARESAALALLNHVRATLTAIEGAGFDAKSGAEGVLRIDWTAWTVLREESGRVPVPGADITGTIEVFE